MHVALLTREFPPEVYGGAGVHVEYLARELARLVDVTVHCQGADRPDAGAVRVRAYRPWPALDAGNDALRTMTTDLAMAAAIGAAQPAGPKARAGELAAGELAAGELGAGEAGAGGPGVGADIVHSHTWYANLGGHVASMLCAIPHVVTCHSLEPLRPWKAEQLGGGYTLSSWCERVAVESSAAVIAVSQGMRDDILTCYPAVDPARVHVIHNGVDTEQYSPDPATDVLDRHGIDPDRPSVVFVGRITRQKGLPVLLRAASSFGPDAQLVLCAGAPDTPELEAEVTGLVDGLRASRDGVVWIPGMLAKHEIVQILSHATVFVCPSVYEPLGIVNLEAMGCGAAVVASRVGGIPEVVADGETGLLVPPGDPARLAAAVNTLLDDRARAKEMGRAGRRLAVERFGWSTIAEQTARLYEQVVHH
jgi:starch synthase